MVQPDKTLLALEDVHVYYGPFHALRGSALVLQAGSQYDIVSLSELRAVDTDCLIIRLDPHLDALSIDFGLVEPTGQLPLFAAMAVR